MTAPYYLPPIGTPPSIELIPPARLSIDASYQRSIDGVSSQKLIKRIARQWDWRLCVPLLVSRRDGVLFVIDGQHRLEGARQRGDIPYLPCCVSDYGTPAEEAAIFVEANGRRRAVGRVDQYRAALLAGDADAVAVERVIAAAGLELVGSSMNGLRPGQINALGTVKSLVANYGEDMAITALTLLRSSYPNRVIHRIGAFSNVVAQLLKRHDADADQLRDLLPMMRQEEWCDLAAIDPDWARGGAYHERLLRSTLIAALQSHLQPRLSAVGGGVVMSPSPAPEPLESPSRPDAEPESFEDKLARIERGEARVVPVFKPVTAAPDMTLGGVGSNF